MIRVKRVYEKRAPSDGFRVLVDRLWPRGLTKERAAVDLWLKEVAPSNELRRWFHHDPSRWDEFEARYRSELREREDALDLLRRKSREGAVTLLFGARDPERNQALVLKDALEAKGRRPRRARSASANRSSDPGKIGSRARRGTTRPRGRTA